jgi:hypothetical protein
MLRHHDEPARHQEKDVAPTKQANAMLAMNAMNYDKPVSASVSIDRVITNFPFSPNSYQGVNPSTLASVIFNTGASFLNAATSSVIFTISFSNAPVDLCWSWGNNTPAGYTLKSGGSAVNMFNSVDLRARGGEYVLRTLDNNVLAAALQPFQKGTGSELLYQSAGGAAYSTSNGGNYRFPVWYCRDSVTFEVPLGKLVPGTFFSEQSPIPPSLVSGLTMSLRFENFLKAMVFYTSNVNWASANRGIPPAYSSLTVASVNPTIANPTLAVNVGNMQLQLDLMSCFDAVTNAINSKASSLASSGLQFDYLGVFSSKTTVVAASANIDVMLSAAQLIALVISFAKPGASADGTYDAMARLPIISYDGTVGNSVWKSSSGSVGQLGANGSIRVRIGSQYLNLSAIQSAGQLFRGTYQALCAVKGGLVTDIDPLHQVNKVIDFNTSFDDWYGTYGGSGASTIAFDCTKTPILGHAGSQTNNSRVLQILLENMNFDAGHPGEVYIHCLYQNICNSSLENNVVDR